MRQRQQRIGTNNVLGGRLLHHPARHMRQRPVRLANNKDLRSRETLPLQDLHALTVARVIPIKDPPIGVVILGSMPPVRRAPAKRISASVWHPRSSAVARAAGSSTWSIWSTNSSRRRRPVAAAGLPRRCCV